MAVADLTESGDVRIIQIKGMGAARTHGIPGRMASAALPGGRGAIITPGVI